MHDAVPSFYVGAGDQNSGSHSYMTDTLLTEPCPKPVVWWFLSMRNTLYVQQVHEKVLGSYGYL